MKGWIPIHSQLGDILFIFSRDRQEGSLRRFSIYYIHNQLNYVVWKLLVCSFSPFSKTWHHEIMSGWCPAYVKTLSDLILFSPSQGTEALIWVSLTEQESAIFIDIPSKSESLWPIPLLFTCILAWLKESWLPVLDLLLPQCWFSGYTGLYNSSAAQSHKAWHIWHTYWIDVEKL